MTKATATIDIKTMISPMTPPAFIESTNVRCRGAGRPECDAPPDSPLSGSRLGASGPTTGLRSSWAISFETKAGCDSVCVSHHTTSSAAPSRTQEAPDDKPRCPKPSCDRYMKTSLATDQDGGHGF